MINYIKILISNIYIENVLVDKKKMKSVLLIQDRFYFKTFKAIYKFSYFVFCIIILRWNKNKNWKVKQNLENKALKIKFQNMTILKYTFKVTVPLIRICFIYVYA